MTELNQQIMEAVDSGFEKQVDFLAKLIQHPSTRGAEQSAQKFMQDELQNRGYETDSWEIDLVEISHLPGFSPVIGEYKEAINVVGKHKCDSPKGKSLILNGHIDVVPVGPLKMWNHSPFEAVRQGNWMFGRGSGDMKAGLAANVFALDALRQLGYQPAADVFLQSVVEEECTGNGALACLQRGYQADAVLIPEPFNEQLCTSQIGVIWLQVQLQGIPVHVLQAKSGSNAIEAAIPIIKALRELEVRWNKDEYKNSHYQHVEHPLNLNIGRIAGGDWPSSVPSWCDFDVRMSIYPGQDISTARQELEKCILTASKADDYLRENPPEIVYHGFLAEGYSLADDQRPATLQAIDTLANAHKVVNGSNLEKIPVTATTDARFFGLYADTPALVYGPIAKDIHGFNECVDLESMRRITQSICLFIADWCQLDKI